MTIQHQLSLLDQIRAEEVAQAERLEREMVSTQTTRQEAERSIKPSAAAYREQVYRCIEWNGPICDEAIAELTGLNPSTARPRRIELAKAGRIEPAGATHTKSGRRAVAWRVVPDPSF